MSVHPDFIVIGAMKCATTTLHAQLEAQPGIFLTDKLDEPDYFSDDDRYRRGPTWYGSCFDGAGPGDLLGEVSTGYTKRPGSHRTVARMRRDVPDARLVYIMRHPVDRLVSHYIHEWSLGGLGGSIDEAVASHSPLVDYGRYAMQLEPYLETFGPEQVLPVFFERLTSCPQSELERICRFIGYAERPEWQDETARQNVSSGRVQRTPFREFVVHTPILRAVRRRLVPAAVREWVRRRWSMRERPVLSPEAARRVTKVFDEDLAMLGRWLGVELTCAEFKSTVPEIVPTWTAEAPRPSMTLEPSPQ